MEVAMSDLAVKMTISEAKRTGLLRSRQVSSERYVIEVWGIAAL